MGESASSSRAAEKYWRRATSVQGAPRRLGKVIQPRCPPVGVTTSWHRSFASSASKGTALMGAMQSFSAWMTRRGTLTSGMLRDEDELA